MHVEMDKIVMNNNTFPCVMTIGGSDSYGGAGIQADIKTFTVFRVFGTSAITCITAQNSQGIQQIYKISSNLVEAQIESVLGDMKINAIKIGIIFSSETIKLLARIFDNYDVCNVILDPIIWTKNRHRVLSDEGINILKEYLFKQTLLITPNLDEASALTKKPITSVNEMKWAARQLYQMGPANVLIKGGHLKDKIYDVLYDGKNEFVFSRERVINGNVHGTGCTLSAAITAELAKGKKIYNSIVTAQKYIKNVIKNSIKTGKGFRQPMHWPIE